MGDVVCGAAGTVECAASAVFFSPCQEIRPPTPSATALTPIKGNRRLTSFRPAASRSTWVRADGRGMAVPARNLATAPVAPALADGGRRGVSFAAAAGIGPFGGSFILPGHRAQAPLDGGAQFGRGLVAFQPVFVQHALQQRAHRIGNLAQLPPGRRRLQMLGDDLRHLARERRPAGEQNPERHPQRIDVRAHVEVAFLQLLGTRVQRRADEARGGQLRVRIVSAVRAREAEVDHLDEEPVLAVLVLVDDHEVRRLDVAVDETLARRRRQRARDLEPDAQRRLQRQRPDAFDEAFQRLAVDELHRVEEPLRIDAQVVDGGDVRVAHPRGDPGLADETLAGGLAVDVVRADDLQGDVAAQVRVERLVGDAHRPAAEFPQRAVRPPENLVVLERFALAGRGGKWAVRVQRGVGIRRGVHTKRRIWAPEQDTFPQDRPLDPTFRGWRPQAHSVRPEPGKPSGRPVPPSRTRS